MLEKLKYINSRNEEISFGENGIYANYNDFRDYEWNHEAVNNKISSFTNGITEKTLPVIIKAGSEEEGLRIKNALFEIAEKDILTHSHGKIVIGEYYLKCFIKGSKKSNYLIDKGYLETELHIVTDLPMWTKESTTAFKAGQVASVGQNKDFPHDYAYDYANGAQNTTLLNSGFADADFEITIYGSCKNPMVVISGHTYSVETELLTGEYLKINSKEKKIYKVKYNGEVVNQFDLRNREYYIFKKISAGTNTVTWNGMFGFDVTLLEERSEPKWT